ncbi:uncharacterized protein TNCV_2818031 [Trichonephila clavipes]|nr:uncharacterized protein TNCV_2818031 [Trichonephila clavipes]
MRHAWKHCPLATSILSEPLNSSPEDKNSFLESEQSDPVDDERDEDEDNNNSESSRGPSNTDTFSALETAMEWYEQQPECCPTQLLLLKRIRDLATKKRSVRFHILHGSHLVFGYPNNRVFERCPVPIDSDKRRSIVSNVPSTYHLDCGLSDRCVTIGRHRASFDQVSEFNPGRIEAYRDCELSFREINQRVERNQATVMRICHRWFQEETTNRRSRSHPPLCTTDP